jgi:hypothetical protein
MSLMSDLEEQKYDDVIEAVRTRAAADPGATFADTTVKKWLALRWKDIFLREAVTDPKAVETAKHTPGLAKVITPRVGRDKRSDRERIADRFLKGITAEDWDTELPEPQHGDISNTTLVLCPGLLSGILHPGAHAFVEEAPALAEERGWRTLRADIHPFRGREANEQDILNAVDRGEGFEADLSPVTDPDPPGRFWFIGYSKGGPDVASFLADHPEYVDRTAAVFTWAGAMGGSYSADTIYQQIKDVDTKEISDNLDKFLKLLNPGLVDVTGLRRVDEYDIKQAFYDLQTSASEEFLHENADKLNDLGVPWFHLTGSTTPLEVPSFQFADTVRMTQFDANNDMQLTQAQARLEIPIATHLAMLHGHHWDIAYGPFPARMRAASPNLGHPFPRKAALAASWRLLAEIGLID